MDKNIGKKLDGRYEITELIGEGGMADVYKAMDITENKVVAVKILKTEFSENEDFQRRFRNESKAIAVLSHPNIVKIMDVGFTDKIQFIVMEYVDGITLKDYIEQEKVIEWKEAVHFIIQVLRALQHAHDRGIVHRDIKPQNIMLLSDGTIKVMDFGIAKFAREDGKTVTDKAIGSVHYISPEQASGSTTDEKSDIYSVGIMLYEMLTGQKPFDTDNPVSIALMHMQSIAIKPREINPEIPFGLEEIILHAMEKNPNGRYLSASAMIKNIEKFKKNPDIIFDYSKMQAVNSAKSATGNLPVTSNTGEITELDNDEYYDEYYDEDDEYYDDENYDEDDDEEDEDEHPKSLFVPILTAVTIVVIIVAVFFVASLISGKFLIGNDVLNSEFPMPDLVGMDYNEAKETYPQLNIIVESKENTEYEVDKIFEQDLAVGTEVKKGIEVKVKISLGVEMVKVPDLTNFEYTMAKSALEQDGLKFEMRTQTDEKVQKDYVIKTEPEAFTDVAPGTTVIVYVSKGDIPVEVTVPNLIGKNVEEAKALCEYNQLLCKVEEVNSTEEAGKVIDQSYAEGTKIPSKTEITLTVSNGIPPKEKVTITFNIPAKAIGRFRFALYIQGEVVGEKSDINVGYTGQVSVTVEGNGTQDVVAEITNLATGNATTIGTYKVYFDSKTYESLSYNVDEKIAAAFEALGGIESETQPPETEPPVTDPPETEAPVTNAPETEPTTSESTIG